MEARHCKVCQGPAAVAFARCYQCELHWRAAGGLLADAVIPIRYAVKGSQLASDLWRYKWSGDDAAAERLRELLREFLRGHGDCVRRAAGMAAPPSRVAIVPSGQGRPGPHPLSGLVSSCLTLPAVPLSARAPVLARGRELDPGWLRVDAAVAGERVLVVDDCWVSGGSVQSAAVALKRAGAARVAVVVLGRHVDPRDRRVAALGHPTCACENRGRAN
jgi:hypothetical protein